MRFGTFIAFAFGSAVVNCLDDLIVQRGVVQPVGNRAAALPRIAGRALKAVLGGDLPLLGLQQICGLQSDRGDALEEVLERNALVAPPAHRLLQPRVLHRRLLRARAGRRQRRPPSQPRGRLQGISS
jgi:hypothetical protein